MTPPSIQELFDPKGNDTRALLLHLATIAAIPTSVMDWLIENQAVESIEKLSTTPCNNIAKYQGEYQVNTSMDVSLWTDHVSLKMRRLIQWLRSYHHAFGGYPHPGMLTRDNFQSSIGQLRFQVKALGVFPEFITSNYSHVPHPTFMVRDIPGINYWPIQCFQEKPKIGLSLSKTSLPSPHPKVLETSFKRKSLPSPIPPMRMITFWTLLLSMRPLITVGLTTVVSQSFGDMHQVRTVDKFTLMPKHTS